MFVLQIYLFLWGLKIVCVYLYKPYKSSGKTYTKILTKKKFLLKNNYLCIFSNKNLTKMIFETKTKILFLFLSGLIILLFLFYLVKQKLKTKKVKQKKQRFLLKVCQDETKIKKKCI